MTMRYKWCSTKVSNASVRYHLTKGPESSFGGPTRFINSILTLYIRNIVLQRSSWLLPLRRESTSEYGGVTRRRRVGGGTEIRRAVCEGGYAAG